LRAKTSGAKSREGSSTFAWITTVSLRGVVSSGVCSIFE